MGEIALAREANGRVHALWTGRLNPHFAQFVFYATAADGVNWTPFQILSYAAGSDPQIAVDDARQRVHLMYRADGIVHHVVENGIVSPPLVVDNTLESRYGLTTGPTRPKVTVAPGTGHVHAVWQQVHFTYINATTIASRFRTWYAYLGWRGLVCAAAGHQRRRHLGFNARRGYGRRRDAGLVPTLGTIAGQRHRPRRTHRAPHGLRPRRHTGAFPLAAGGQRALYGAGNGRLDPPDLFRR